MDRDCPFCGHNHHSDYVDELEEAVLQCRQRARDTGQWDGSLDGWDGKLPDPTPEIPIMETA